MNAALSIEVPLSTPCLQKRHSRCQLGGSGCGCECHSPDSVKVARNERVDEAEHFLDATFLWLDACEGELIVAVEAQKFVAYMRETNPKRFNAWLEERATHVVSEAMGRQMAGTKHGFGGDHQKASPRGDKARIFGTAADHFEEGDASDLDALHANYKTEASGGYLTLAQMRHPDFTYPIAVFDKRAKSAQMHAAYLRAIRKQLPIDGSKTVEDVFTNEQLLTLREAATQTK